MSYVPILNEMMTAPMKVAAANMRLMHDVASGNDWAGAVDRYLSGLPLGGAFGPDGQSGNRPEPAAADASEEPSGAESMGASRPADPVEAVADDLREQAADAATPPSGALSGVADRTASPPIPALDPK